MERPVAVDVQDKGEDAADGHGQGVPASGDEPERLVHDGPIKAAALGEAFLQLVQVLYVTKIKVSN